MASSSVPPREKRKRPSNKNAPTRFTSPESEALGLTFTTQEQLSSFNRIYHWKIVSTRFAHRTHLNKLHIHGLVTKLFDHIGWGDVLGWHAQTYREPTLEFLSTAYLSPDKLTLHFRTRNTDCSVPMRDISELGSDSDPDLTYSPDDLHTDNMETLFWGDISDDPYAYDARMAKASSIRHPALRVAHRLIALLFFAREDHGTVSFLELHLLYAMTHGDPEDASRPKPDFARWLLHKPLSLAQGRKTKIMCGGIITYILKSQLVPANLRLTDTGRHPISTKTRLDIDTLQRIGMFTIDRDRLSRPTHWVWLRYPDNTRYLSLPVDADAPGSDLLYATDDIREQNWNLPANTDGAGPVPVPRPARQPRLPQHVPDPAGAGQYQPPPPEYPPYHYHYMDEFDYIRTRVDTIESSQVEDRATATTRYEAQQATLRTQQTSLDEMLRLQRQMMGMYFHPPPPPGLQ